MAYIDKTYVSSYEEWKSIIDWCKNNSFTCPNGIVIHPINYCYDPDLSKEEVEDWLNESSGEIPIMNTSYSMDYFLIKYCPIELVQNRMKTVYGEEYYNSIKNGTSKFDTFVRKEGGKHIGWIRKPLTNFTYAWYNRYLKKRINRGYSVQVSGDFWYNEDYDYWVDDYELGYHSSNTADTNCRSIKSLIRKVLKWNLPTGTKVRFFGRFTCECGEFIIKK